MQEREDPEPVQEPGEAAPVQTPPLGRGVPQVQHTQVSVDSMPVDKAVLARLSAEERIAVYLNSIRKMLIFFTVLAVIGIAAGIIIGIIDIHTVQQSQQCVGLGC